MTKQEYEKLKDFFIYFTYWFSSINQTEVELRSQLNEFLGNIEKRSIANAKRGLQMAVNDIIEESYDWDHASLVKADARFKEIGVFTLSEVRLKYGKKFLKIVKNDVIKNETEYYLIKGVFDAGLLGDRDIEASRLQQMMLEFEKKHMNMTGHSQK